jgi:nucleotide-binding universal stress UspA family protein
MIKTILIPSTGSDADNSVFMSGLVLARAFGAHIDFLHVRVDAASIAVNMAADSGGATMLGGLIGQIEEEAGQREEKAKQLFQRFCEREKLALANAPPGLQGPSARWIKETGVEPNWVTEYGRAADLLIIGRSAGDSGVSSDTVEAALLDCGRPVLIPPASPIAAPPETIVIAWKARPEAARAVTAAMPFLALAKQILVLTVAEDRGPSDEEGARLAANLRWHGFQASARHLRPDRHGAAETLLSAAGEHGALVVMGAYGHSRLRQWIFGGFTYHVLSAADLPVLMMH